MRPLKHIFFQRSIAIALVPMLLAGVLVGVWFYPQLRQNLISRQLLAADASAARIEGYLTEARCVVSSVAISCTSGSDDIALDSPLNRQIEQTGSLRALYVIGGDGRIISAGLPPQMQSHATDLIGLDLSRLPLYQQVLREKRPLWSDTFLSLISGNISVAYAVPTAFDKVVVGEIELSRLTSFLTEISGIEGMEIYIIDHLGQVIASHNPRISGNQTNISNIEIVAKSIHQERHPELSAAYSTTFDFYGREMIGCITNAHVLDWHILIAQTKHSTLAPLYSTATILIVTLFLILAIEIALAFRIAGRMAHQFELLTRHAARIAEGDVDRVWPESSIYEFSQLNCNLHSMALTIRERENQLSTLMSNLPGMVYRCLPHPDRPISFASAGSTSLVAMKPEELIGKMTLCELTHPEDCAALQEEIVAASASKLPYQLIYRVIPRDSQREKWVMDIGRQVIDHDSETLLLEGFITDITDKVEAEQKVLEALSKAEIANQAKSIFLANMSHELRTPLNGTLGSLQLLELTELDDDQDALVKTAAKCGWSLLQLLNDILDMTRIEAGKMSIHEDATEIAPLIDDVLATLRLESEKKGLTIDYRLPPESSSLRLDGGRLRQILFNLVGNAIKFTPQGEIHIEISPPRTLANGRGAVEITVRDTGVGIPQEKVPLLGKPFMQVEESHTRKFQGAGLGLSIVHRLAELMNGSMTIESQEGVGTTVRVVLEAGLILKDSTPPPEVVTTHTASAKGLRILAVEDNEVNLKALRLMLERCGHHVVTASDGEGAIARFHEGGIELILMDVHMPGIDGPEATRIIRTMPGGDSVPIIAVTAHAMSGDRDHFMQAGMNDYISKPFTLSSLVTAIENACKRDPV